MGLLRFGRSPNPHLHRRGWPESRVTSYPPPPIAGGGAHHPLRHPPVAVFFLIHSRYKFPPSLPHLFAQSFLFCLVCGVECIATFLQFFFPVVCSCLHSKRWNKDLIFLRGGEHILFEIRTSIFQISKPGRQSVLWT